MARRTQQERTAATRQQLIDAALELLDERGWAATTSVAVVERADLTRGALVHQFGDLPALMADALDAQYDRLAERVAAQPTSSSMAELVDQTWGVVAADRFKVVIEAWLAAANDPDLGEAIGPVVDRFAKLVHPAHQELLADPDAQALFLTIREAIFGLALGRATNGGPLPHEDAVVGCLVDLARTHDASAGGSS